ncbi:MAG TPA: BatA domain-containing protein, partial [Anaerolineales bacterium]|nr:BatA domain-containing protein [Anaerolineales bacterium]
MSFIQPSALLFGLLALPILLFYMLRMRRKEQQVPSTLLWSGLLLDRRASTPWQRLRRNLLLLLQLLILAGLVLAMARPAVPTAAVAGDTLIVLLDASASMQAVDVSPNRFEAARQAAEDLIEDLSPGAAMTL